MQLNLGFIKKLQKKEVFTIDDFKLEHLVTEQEKTLGKLLLTYYSSISNTMMKQGHTDKVVPNLKLLNDTP